MYFVGIFLIIGIAHGVVFNWLFKNRGISQSGNIVLGVIGAMVGGVAASSLGPTEFGPLMEILISATGALVFLYLANLIELAFNGSSIEP